MSMTNSWMKNSLVIIIEIFIGKSIETSLSRIAFSKMTVDEYEKRAELLQSMPVDNKKVFGYYGEHRASSGVMRNAYYKYNKETQEYVVYTYLSDGQPRTITYFRIPWSQYNGDKASQYVDEIELGK